MENLIVTLMVENPGEAEKLDVFKKLLAKDGQGFELYYWEKRKENGEINQSWEKVNNFCGNLKTPYYTISYPPGHPKNTSEDPNEEFIFICSRLLPASVIISQVNKINIQTPAVEEGEKETRGPGGNGEGFLNLGLWGKGGNKKILYYILAGVAAAAILRMKRKK